jgi:outer membrane receptor protein involved in Fe transport
MGGTVRVIPELPKPGEFSGSLSAGGSYTADYGDSNSNVQGIINVPFMQDELAVRAVAYSYDYSGYFRNVAASDPVKSASAAATGALALDRDDVARSEFTGGRIAARWTPGDRLSVDLTYLRQDVEQQGNPLGDLALGKFDHARYARFSNRQGEFNGNDLEVWNVVLEYDFGPLGLVSSSSWNNYGFTEDWEVGQFWTFLYGDDAPIWILNNTRYDTFVQEVRLSSQWNRPINFLAGFYYEDQDDNFSQLVEWDGDPASDPFGGALMSDYSELNRFEQLAFFGELSYEISDTLVATAGIRRFEYDSSFSEAAEGFLWGGPYEDGGDSNEDDYTGKLNLSWSPNDTSLYYVQWAEGFRPGRPVGSPTPGCDLDNDGLLDGLGLPAPTSIDSDTLDSYEVGSKLSFGNGRIDVRAAAYYNDWKKIPILLVADCAVGFAFNAAEAMTTGLELEGSARLGTQWQVDFSAGYTKAELTTDAPGLGVDGDRLPGTPEYLATLGLQREFQFREQDGYARIDVATVGGYYNNLQEQGEEIGDYTTVSLAAGLDMGNWDAQLFIQNLTNSDAATWVFFLEEYPSAYRIRPRTMGVSLRFRFGDSH